MKKITSFLNLLAVSLVLFAGVCPANAAPALLGFSPTPARDPNGVQIGGNAAGVGALPAWFQGQDGVAVKPCLDLANCLAAGAPDFNPAFPLSYPTNFPSEFFYFDATNANIPVGTGNALVVMALEITFLDALGNLTSPVLTPTARANPFQRLRLTHTFIGGGGVIAFPVNSNFTVTTPWGTAIFPATSVKCVKQGLDTKCTVSRDQPVGGPDFIAALGDTILAPGSISTFLKSPTAPSGFLGLGAAVLSFTGAPAGNLNQITVTDPFGATGTTAGLTLLMGQTVGLEITPPAAGNDFGVVKPANAPPVTKTFTVNNLTGAVVGLTVPPAAAAPLTFTANVSNVITSAVSPDFTVVPSVAIVAPATKACAVGAGATMAIGEICNFDVIFNPALTSLDGPKTATIFIFGANAPTAQVTVTSIADGTAPTLTVDPISFTNVATPTIFGTVFDATAVASVQVTVGTVLPVTATITPPVIAGGPSTWSKVVTLPILNAGNIISVTANDTALTGGNITTAPTFTITHDNIKPVVTPTVTPALNGSFTNTGSPTLTPNVVETNLASTIVTVDTSAPSTNVVPTTLVLGPLANGPHTVKVDAIDSAGNPGTGTISFTVDTIAPVIRTAPLITAAGTIGITSPVLPFSFIDDVNPDLTKTKVTLDNSLTPLVIPPSGNIPLGTFVVGEPHTLTIDTTDLAGNVATQKIVPFTLLFADGSITTLGATDPTIADVILALKVAIGGFPEVATITSATDAFKHGDVAPLDAAGKPVPDGKIDLSDVLTILKKVAGITTTF